jgi:hypothetical protein
VGEKRGDWSQRCSGRSVCCVCFRRRDFLVPISAVGMPIVVLTWGEIKNLEQFYEAIKRAAALNRTAATCAGSATILQATALLME